MITGILALQGDYAKHREVCDTLGVQSRYIRSPGHLENVDSLIIPGGESTTIGKLLNKSGLIDVLRSAIHDGLPVFGTCAGMILLAQDLVRYQQPGLQVMDITVERNAYGRQIESFEDTISIPSLGDDPIRAVFIRAPRIARMGNDVEVLATYDNYPVLVRQRNMLAGSFHPELVGETRLHRFFLDMAERQS